MKTEASLLLLISEKNKREKTTTSFQKIIKGNFLKSNENILKVFQ